MNKVSKCIQQFGSIINQTINAVQSRDYLKSVGTQVLWISLNSVKATSTSNTFYIIFAAFRARPRFFCITKVLPIETLHFCIFWSWHNNLNNRIFTFFNIFRDYKGLWGIPAGKCPISGCCPTGRSAKILISDHLHSSLSFYDILMFLHHGCYEIHFLGLFSNSAPRLHHM